MRVGTRLPEHGPPATASQLRQHCRHAGARIRHERRRVGREPLPDQLDGATGATGSAGRRGEEGPEGASALSQLEASGSESGVYGIAAERSSGGHLATAVTFAKPLAATIPASNFIYTASGTPVAHCGGPGKADAGYLCVYSSLIEGLLDPQLVDPETGAVGVSTGRLGFVLKWKATASKAFGEEELDFGTYTVSAP
jgi:hypothetical protein